MNMLQHLATAYNTAPKITGLCNDIYDIKNSSKVSMFCSGLQYKAETSTSKLLYTVAKGALYGLLTIPTAIYSVYSYQNGDYEKSKQVSAIFAATFGAIIYAKGNAAKEFVVDTVLQGYYARISESVEKHLGDTISADQKELMKKNLQKFLGDDTPLESLPILISQNMASYIVNAGL